MFFSLPGVLSVSGAPQPVTRIYCYVEAERHTFLPVCPVCSGLISDLQSECCTDCGTPLDWSQIDRALIVLCGDAFCVPPSSRSLWEGFFKS